MNKSAAIFRLALSAVPAAAAGAALSFFWLADYIDRDGVLLYATAMASATLVLAVEAAWLLVEYLKSRPRFRQLGRQRDFLERRAKFLEGRLAMLEEDVEVLAAMRQVARAAASHEGLDRVLEETLKIVQELVSADWVTVFVYDEKSDTLTPRAHRRGKLSFLGRKIPPELIDDTNVADAFNFGSAIKTVEEDRLQAAIPALSGGAKLGIVAVSAPLSGTPEDKAQRVEVFESALRDIAEHIAYALRAMSLQTRAYEDDLTGLGNRGLFDQRLAETAALALRKNQPLSLVLVDLDHFKSINDTYGHQMGDHVLREVSALLRKNLRRYDTAYRYGGEELALILPQTDLPDAVRLADRIRAKLEKRSFGTQRFQVTASFGAATLGGQTLDTESLIAASDTQVYKAKAAGRNRVEPAALLGVEHS